MKKDCCSPEACDCNCDVKVTVEVNKIVRALCIAAVLIIGIIFGTKTFRTMLESGLVKIED
jgi:hypothetical protein